MRMRSRLARALDCLRLLAERGVCATTSVAGRSPLFSAVRCLATFMRLHERGASLAESATAQIDLPLVRLRIRTAPAAPLDTPLDAAILNGAIDVVGFLLANGALVDERALKVCSTRACVSAHTHAAVRPLLRRFRDCSRTKCSPI